MGSTRLTTQSEPPYDSDPKVDILFSYVKASQTQIQYVYRRILGRYYNDKNYSNKVQHGARKDN